MESDTFNQYIIHTLLETQSPICVLLLHCDSPFFEVSSQSLPISSESSQVMTWDMTSPFHRFHNPQSAFHSACDNQRRWRHIWASHPKWCSGLSRQFQKNQPWDAWPELRPRFGTTLGWVRCCWNVWKNHQISQDYSKFMSGIFRDVYPLVKVYNGKSPLLMGKSTNFLWAMASIANCNTFPEGNLSSIISWFINPINIHELVRYIYHKPQNSATYTTERYLRGPIQYDHHVFHQVSCFCLIRCNRAGLWIKWISSIYLS